MIIIKRNILIATQKLIINNTTILFLFIKEFTTEWQAQKSHREIPDTLLKHLCIVTISWELCPQIVSINNQLVAKIIQPQSIVSSWQEFVKVFNFRIMKGDGKFCCFDYIHRQSSDLWLLINCNNHKKLPYRSSTCKTSFCLQKLHGGKWVNL